MMKILNISFILPLDGLLRENDIIIQIQDHLKKNFGYNFRMVKFLPYTPWVLQWFSNKWKIYYKYQKLREIEVEGFPVTILPWIMPPSSNFWLNYILIPANLLFFKFFTKRKIIVDLDKVDLILAQYHIPDAIVANLLSKIFRKPYIITVRGESNPAILSLPLMKNVYKNARNIITPSPQDKRKISKKVAIQLVPHPIQKCFFMVGEKDYQLPVQLISVCRLLKLKNIDWVINALYTLKKSGYEFCYKIIGDGPELNYLRKLVSRYELSNEIYFLGYKDHCEIPAYLRSAHLFVMPSNPETLGISFLEAIASKCLIIGHKNTGVDGMLKHGESAIFVEKNSVAGQIKFIFDNFSSEFITSYIRRAEVIVKDLNWDKTGNRYSELFERAIF